MKELGQFTPVLYPIEKAIDEYVRGDRSIVDLHVMDVVSALARRYALEADGRTFKRPKLDARTLPLYDALEGIVEMLLGRRPRAADVEFLDERTFEADVVIAALRRL